MTAQPDPADLRASVWRAAGELFARSGFGEVTIRAIAARAGTSPALVMKVAGSKEELFHRTATITAPELPDVPVSRLGEALVAELIDRQRRGDLEHLGRALMLRVNAPDP
ncbi:MAG: helix-turn-helix domain-containing protein, partial [Aeromicrobium sp.]